MVEPYATMLEHLRLGCVIRRTRDVRHGAPGCSPRIPTSCSAWSAPICAGFAETNRDESAKIAQKNIGISLEIFRKVLDANRPNRCHPQSERLGQSEKI